MTEIKLYQPLSDRLRPQTLDEFVGQRHLLGEKRALSKLFASKRLHSMIFGGRQEQEKQLWRG